MVADYHSGLTAISIRSKSNAAALVAAGHDVTVITGSRGFDPVVQTKSTRTSPSSNKSSLVRRLIGEAFFGIEVGVRVLFSRKVDHFLFTTPPFIATLFAILGAKIRILPYSLDVRDRYPEVYVSNGFMRRGDFAHRLFCRIENWLYLGATHVITVTDGLSREIDIQAKINSSVVMNGYSNCFFLNSARSDDLRNNVTIIMHGNFGALFDEVTFAHLVNSLQKKSSNYVIRLIGSGSKMDYLRGLMLPRVEIIGELPQEQVALYLSEADIGISIHKAYDEKLNGFPVKVFEFIGSLLPSVVIPRHEGGRLVESEGMGAAFDATDVERAADELGRLISDVAYRESIRTKLLAQRSAYSRDVQAKLFSDIISN